MWIGETVRWKTEACSPGSINSTEAWSSTGGGARPGRSRTHRRQAQWKAWKAWKADGRSTAAANQDDETGRTMVQEDQGVAATHLLLWHLSVDESKENNGGLKGFKK